jgi:hypothetical protein
MITRDDATIVTMIPTLRREDLGMREGKCVWARRERHRHDHRIVTPALVGIGAEPPTPKSGMSLIPEQPFLARFADARSRAKALKSCRMHLIRYRFHMLVSCWIDDRSRVGHVWCCLLGVNAYLSSGRAHDFRKGPEMPRFSRSDDRKMYAKSRKIGRSGGLRPAPKGKRNRIRHPRERAVFPGHSWRPGRGYPRALPQEDRGLGWH